MSCHRLAERLAAFADGEPDAEVDTHVQTCASCRAEVGALRETLRAARRSGASEAKDEKFWTDFTRDVRVAYYEEDQRRRRRWMLGVLGLGLAATVILFAVVLPRRAERPEQVAVPPPAPEVETAPFEIPAETEEDLDEAELDAVLVELDEQADEVLAAAVEDAEVVEAEPDGDPEATVETLDDDELERVLEALSKGV